MPRCRICATATSASAPTASSSCGRLSRKRGDGYLHQRRRHLGPNVRQRRALLRQVPRRSRAGGRCLGHLLADTLAGPRPIAFSVDAEGKMTEATVNMGAPISGSRARARRRRAGLPPQPMVRLCRASAPRFAVGSLRIRLRLRGNPHAVCLVDDWAALPDELFPAGANPSRPCASIFPAPSSRRIPYFPRKPTSSSPPSPMRASPCACGRGAAARPWPVAPAPAPLTRPPASPVGPAGRTILC